jgi:hypothetical protein
MSKTFTCAICHEEFVSPLDSEEAVKELEENFPGIEKEDCVTVCDDCYEANVERLMVIHQMGAPQRKG